VSEPGSDTEVDLLFFHPADLKNHWIFGIRTTEMAHPLFFFPGDIPSESQSGDSGEQRMKRPRAELERRKALENEFVPHLQIEWALPFFQNLYHLNFDLITFQIRIESYDLISECSTLDILNELSLQV
jgi:hypothetical protein